MKTTIRFYATNACGARSVGFDVPAKSGGPNGPISVLVSHWDAERNKEVEAVAHELANVADIIAERDRLQALLKLAAAENVSLDKRVPPDEPKRLLGTGCVRFRDGELWLLSRREDGWASFGVRLESWDDLFRRYNCRVTANGTDEAGDWWEVASC